MTQGFVFETHNFTQLTLTGMDITSTEMTMGQSGGLVSRSVRNTLLPGAKVEVRRATVFAESDNYRCYWLLNWVI